MNMYVDMGICLYFLMSIKILECKGDIPSSDMIFFYSASVVTEWNITEFSLLWLKNAL